MPSATFAERRLSIAASAATANAAPNRSLSWPAENDGSDGIGKELGNAPIFATSMPGDLGDSVAMMTARSDEGNDRCIRGATTMTLATMATNPSAARLPFPNASTTARTAIAAVFSPAGLATPSAAGICCKKMITAMPTVNPSTTGHGMKAR